MSKNDILSSMQEDIRGFENHNEEAPSPKSMASSLPGFKKTLATRRSIRVYDGKPIPEAIMRDCLADAILAPSSSNLQPYQLIWIRNETLKKKVAQACLGQPAATTAGELIVITARRDLWNANRKKLLDIISNGGSKKLPKSIDTYYNKLIPKVMANDRLGLANLSRKIGFSLVGLKKPIVRAPVNQGDHRIWAHVQSSLAAQTLMLSLTAHGYDSCPMGGMDEKRIKKILKLPNQAEVTMVISAGTRKPEGLYGPRVRLDTTDLILEL